MNKSIQKGSFKSSLLLIIFSTLLALVVARVAFRLIASELVVSYQPAAGEFVKDEEYGRWPGSSLLRTGNRKGEFDNFPIVHDNQGFTIGRIPEILFDRKLSGFSSDQQHTLRAHYINISPLYQAPGRQSKRQLLLTVGDSNIRVNFEHLRQQVLPESVLVSDSFGVPNTGPDKYYYAVARWLSPDGDIDDFLVKHPFVGLEVDVYITPHNDLEDLRGKPDPEKSRLFFPGADLMDGAGNTAEPVKPATAAAGSSKRDRLKGIANILGLNAEEITVLRSALARILPKSAFSDSRSFTPSVDKPATRRALAYLDMIEQELERYATPGREVRMNLIVWPSVYDMPSMKLAYTWDALMDEYAAGVYLAPGTDRHVQVRNLRFRELFQAWHETDEDYTALYHKGDLHYTAQGMADLSIALAIRKGLIPGDWLDGKGMLTDDRRAWLRENLLEQHRLIMQEMSHAAGEQD